MTENDKKTTTHFLLLTSVELRMYLDALSVYF